MTIASSIFDPHFVTQLALMFEERISFNRLLGLRITALEAETLKELNELRAQLAAKEEALKKEQAKTKPTGKIVAAFLEEIEKLKVNVRTTELNGSEYSGWRVCILLAREWFRFWYAVAFADGCPVVSQR